MKQCPQCHHTYADDLRYCLSDGTPLVSVADEHEKSTVVRTAKRNEPAGETRGFNPLFIVLPVGAFLALLLLVGGLVLLKIFWPPKPGPIVSDSNTPTPIPTVSTPTPAPSFSMPIFTTPTTGPTRFPANPTPTARTSDTPDLQTQQEAIERERQRLAEERRQIEEQRRRQEESQRITPPVTDPPTTRIVFHRGSVSETIPGIIGSARSYVLRTLYGQYLSATVRSPGGCVVFGNGYSTIAYTTNQGDSYLSLRNNCGGAVRYNITVVVR